MRASARSSGTATRTIPANFPARRAISLRSQLPPWSAMTPERAETRPDRSSPITVSTSEAMSAGYRRAAVAVLPLARLGKCLGHVDSAIATIPDVHRIFGTSVASVYPLYLAKVERKGGRRLS